MSSVFKIYQTLEQRYNHDEIEEDGPFPCPHNTSWAYTGYYFWEHHIALGKFWGEKIYKSQNKDYVICESEYELNEDLCFNYEGNPYRRDEFFDSVCALIESGAIKESDNLHTVLKYMRMTNIMEHDAFRFVGDPTMSKNDEHYEGLLIRNKRGINVELRKIREVQIVFFEKFACNRSGFEIVFESDLEVA